MTTFTEIEAGLIAAVAAVPDGFLPELRVEENGDGTRTAWVGGRGYMLHKATRAGKPDPEVHVTNAIDNLLHAEAVRRLEVAEGYGAEPSDSARADG